MSDYQKKVEDAPYHPGYEDAVVPPKQVYSGMDAGKMIWKSKPLTEEEINNLGHELIDVEYFDEGEYGMQSNIYGFVEFARAIEEKHGIK